VAQTQQFDAVAQNVQRAAVVQALAQAVEALDSYIRCYNEKRIKLSLGFRSPIADAVFPGGNDLGEPGFCRSRVGCGFRKRRQRDGDVLELVQVKTQPEAGDAP